MDEKRLSFHLPQEIIVEILLRLPFESILTCKLVSKKWKNLINDPKIFNRYNPKSSLSIFFEDEYSLYCLLIRHSNTNPGTVEGRRHPPFTVHRLPIDLRRGTTSERCVYNHSVLLSGSSNGVACVLVSTGEFLIYNLFNGASYTVADAPVRQHSFYAWRCFGFGYDRYDADYKIVVVCKCEDGWRAYERLKLDINTVQSEDNSVFWVLSLRSLVWKRLKGYPYATYDRGCSTIGQDACCFNGVLHWVVTVRGSQRVVILTYDLNTCRFGEVSIPSAYDFGLPEGGTMGCFGELNGHLCYWIEVEVRKTDVWVMKEYGVRESWTHLILVNRKPGWGWLIPTGLYECRNGRKGVLFVSPYGSLYWCKFDSGKTKVVEATRCRRRGRKKQIREQADLRYLQKCFLG